MKKIYAYPLLNAFCWYFLTLSWTFIILSRNTINTTNILAVISIFLWIFMFLSYKCEKNRKEQHV